MRAINLKTEYLADPLGIDIVNPRFFWQCPEGFEQKAYQIIAKKDNAIIWNSSKVISSETSHIPYEGPSLNSRDRIEWSIKLWNQDDQESEVSFSFFEMGLLDKMDWVGKWISGNYEPKKNKRYPIDSFRKTFELTKKPIKARLYITALGIYKASLNNNFITDFELAPGSTDYNKRLHYQTYDITPYLEKDNTFELSLGDGWYRGSLGAYGQTHVYGRKTKLLCQIEIYFEDGSKKIIGSDDSFSWSNDGPVRFNDLKDGEIYDSNKNPSYKGYASLSSENRNLIASNNVFPKKQEILEAKLITSPKGKLLLDFGQNIAGFLSFKLKGPKGKKVKFRLGEILDNQGEFTQNNFQLIKPVNEWGPLKAFILMIGIGKKLKNTQFTPKQEITFICSGKEETFISSFSIAGFRYALIEADDEIEIKESDFSAIAVYSDMESVGEFKTSNEKLNKLHENILWSMKGNFLDVPTDCPTRERMGWTGDAQIFFKTGAYLMDVASFYRKYLYDMVDAVRKNGLLPAVIPFSGMRLMYENSGISAGWADAAILIPYRFFEAYGDIRLLEYFYNTLSLPYAQYLIKNTGCRKKKEEKTLQHGKYVYEKGLHLGEWLEPEEFKDDISAFKQANQREVATAYLHYSMTHMVKMAKLLNKNGDIQIFGEYAEGAKNAYIELYLAKSIPNTNRQAKLVRPLAMGIYDNQIKAQLEEQLAKAVINLNYRVSTGFLSTAFLLPMLSEANRDDLAYKVLLNEEKPGWLYEVNKGASTIWEDWEGKVSHNHYSPGSVAQWLYQYVGGIEIVGKRSFQIKPRIDASLDYAYTSYKSLFGKVESKWSINEDICTFEIVIPGNTKAIFIYKNIEKELSSGRYTFIIKI